MTHAHFMNVTVMREEIGRELICHGLRTTDQGRKSKASRKVTACAVPGSCGYPHPTLSLRTEADAGDPGTDGCFTSPPLRQRGDLSYGMPPLTLTLSRKGRGGKREHPAQ